MADIERLELDMDVIITIFLATLGHIFGNEDFFVLCTLISFAIDLHKNTNDKAYKG